MHTPTLTALLKTAWLLFAMACANAKGQVITTFAGGGSGGDGGPATAANIDHAGGVVVDNFGNVYFTENDNKIRKVSYSGIISTIAGTGVAGFSGDGGPATAATMNGPSYVTVDTFRNIYFTDLYNNRIRKIDAATGIITTVAGTGIGGFSGDGGPATSAMLYSPQGLSVNLAGELYFCDYHNYRIRHIDKFGIITTIAGNGIMSYSGDGGPATAAAVYAQYGLQLDKVGNIYFADGYRARRIDATTGIISTVAGTGAPGFSGDGGLATTAQTGVIYDVTINSLYDIFISDTWNNRVRKVSHNGIVSTVVGTGTSGFSGDGGTATAASIYSPRGLAVDTCGNLLIADNGNGRIRKVAFNPGCWPLPVRDITNPLSIYPNPATETLQIQTSQAGSYQLCNMLGVVVRSGVLRSGDNVVNVSELDGGVYVLRVEGEDGGVTVKRIVLNQ